MQGIEKRVHPRVPLVTKVEAEAEGHSFLAVTQDVSSGGMRIATANPLALGAHLQLVFVLPGSERKIHVRAVVRHIIEGTAMGIQFLDISPEDKAALLEFLRTDSSP